MGFFSKSKEQTTRELPNYQKESITNSFERIIFEHITTDEDEYIMTLAQELLSGNPLVLNFEEQSPDSANKIMAFLSGVIFAVEGQIVQISQKVFLFAREQDFKDGTLKQFIDEYKE
ncbi:MAG TPA: hypothetical protein DEA45_01480 [Acholeplasmataceae bacterium]|jgi:cell division inhibitor SepF|nr:hypothetical protein [Acholeplasmataceae bacterium]